VSITVPSSLVAKAPDAESTLRERIIIIFAS